MMPELHADIYRHIVDIITEPDKESRVTAHSTRQRELASLSLVSKSFWNKCRPKLYKDCLVTDIRSFLQMMTSPTKNTLLQTVETIRLDLSLDGPQPTYCNLLSSDVSVLWDTLGRDWIHMPTGTEDQVRWARMEDQRNAGDLLARAINHLRQEQFNPLPGLKRVIMAQCDDTQWGTIPDDWGTTCSITASILPYALLDIPNVDHYCQTSLCGPLHLPHNAYRFRNPPKTVTFHPVFPQTFLANPQPGLVLGAINRYMFPQHHHNFGSAEMVEAMNEDDELNRILAPILGCLSNRSYVSLPQVVTAPNHHGYPDAEADLAGTILEFYNYARQNPILDEPPLDLRFPSGSMSIPPCDLAPLHKRLEHRLPPEWKGKVFLKNIEDCPACSACGMKGKWVMGELEWPLLD